MMIAVADKRILTKSNPKPPLCVDLDGTLIKSDLLYESVFALLRQSFLYLFMLPFWLLRGKAHLKHQIAVRTQLDVETLPYREDVVAFLRQEKERGRYLLLATASHVRLARPIADYLNLFDEVIATDDEKNLKGPVKLEALQRHYSRCGFDYVGDSKADLPLWKEARRSYLVQPSRRLLTKAESICQPALIFGDAADSRKPQKMRVRSVIKLLRPHQWVKNLLLLVPLVLAHQLTNWTALGAAVFAFAAFCLCASSVYILNDLIDLPADRRHPHKKNRPLASGAVSIPLAVALFAGLLVSGIGLTLLVHPLAFTGMLLLYMAVTTAYSLRLKREPIVDVFVLAGLYTVRILAGGVAVGIAVTGWLTAFSLFFFISLALVKRYSELARAASENCEELEHRGYRIEDLGLIQSVGPASGYMAVLTMCLYINAHDVLRLYTTPDLLWGISFVLFFWITRVWFLARRRQLNEDPVVFATTDFTSYLSGLAVVGVLVMAA